MALLTFNLSTSDLSIFNEEYFQQEYYQITPSSRKVLNTTTVDKFPKINNPNILIHMNYLTYVFNEKAIMNGSMGRSSLKAFNRLADRLGTKNILIHMPRTKKEFTYIKFGMQVIYDELLDHDKILQFETVPWDKELQELFELCKDPIKAVTRYLNIMIKTVGDNDKVKIVFDTAHLYALGLDGNMMIKLMDKYKDYISYIHLNGNMKSMYTSDTHSVIFSDNNKFADTMDSVVKYCSENKFVCVMEITKEKAEWEDYEKFAKEYGFRLVQHHKSFNY